MSAQRALLDGGRWHLQHGPIDIVIAAEGDAAAVGAAHEAAWKRFETVLDELVVELRVLRLPIVANSALDDCPLQGAVARRMWTACLPFAAGYITPMAAVAGSVADELIPFLRRAGITRAWVNNGGDIALHLAPGARTRIGLFADMAAFEGRTADGRVRTDAAFTLTDDVPVRGVATSGWRGRSFSLGIADSVTVLARNAAEADAAATVIANAVDVDAPGIVRRPASALKDDSDLGDMPVTVDVPTLNPADRDTALARGKAVAAGLQATGRIHSAMLVCQGQWMAVQAPQSLAATPLVQYLLNERT
ncbi:MAG: hypothetical protein JWP52_2202 [Rhizobacter sp.]|nr:hypothetical protein [Rhizobacter sp.]